MARSFAAKLGQLLDEARKILGDGSQQPGATDVEHADDRIRAVHGELIGRRRQAVDRALGALEEMMLLEK